MQVACPVLISLTGSDRDHYMRAVARLRRTARRLDPCWLDCARVSRGGLTGKGLSKASPDGFTITAMKQAMPDAAVDIGALVDEVLASTPLRFVREFLRSQKQTGRRIRIGTTRTEAKKNLHEAIAAGDIGVRDLEDWYREVEGWGKQHLYIFATDRKVGLRPQLLSTTSLMNYLKKRQVVCADAIASADSKDAMLSRIDVDDEWARFSVAQCALTLGSDTKSWMRSEKLEMTRTRMSTSSGRIDASLGAAHRDLWDLQDGWYRARPSLTTPWRRVQIASSQKCYESLSWRLLPHYSSGFLLRR